MAGHFWRIRRGLIAAAWVAIFLLAGCSSDSPETLSDVDGGATYEERLQATADEFAYYSLLDANLAAEVWESEGVSLRVPKPFQFVPESASRNPAQGHALSREILGEPLPGVLGVWKAELPGQASRPPETAYLFLMSNHHLWSHSKKSAMAFHQALVEDVLAELSGLSVLPIEADWKPANMTGHGQPYTVGRFEAKLPQTGSSAEFTMFLFQQGANQRHDEIKAALLFVVPENADFTGSQPDADPKALSAQTLRIIPRPTEPR